MRLIQVNNSCETFTATASGAIATHIWEIVRVASQSGLECLVLSQDAPQPPLPDVDLIRLPVRPPLPHGWRHQCWRIRRRLFGWREAHQRGYAEHVAHAIRKGGFQRDWVFLHNDPELAVYLRGVFPRLRLLHHFHNPVESHRRFQAPFRSAVSVATAVSGYVAREVERLYGCSSVRVVLNGVDTQRFSPAVRQKEGTVGLSFLGRTGIEKAPDLFLRAALTLARMGLSIRVQLIGSNHWGRWEPDAYQEELARLCDQLSDLGVEVHRAGHVSRVEVPEHLGRSDIHVLPSRWEEPCALSLLEGMAAGLAVVASRTGGTPEVLAGCGRLFERDSEAGLVEQLRDLISNAQERLRYAALARLRAEALNWRACWEGFVAGMA